MTGIGEFLIFGCITLYGIVMYVIQLYPGDLYLFLDTPTEAMIVPLLAAAFCITTVFTLDRMVKEASKYSVGEYDRLFKSQKQLNDEKATKDRKKYARS